MKNLLMRFCFVLVGLLVIVETSRAQDCPSFTPEQEELMQLACAIGRADDWCYTLAALIEEESFVGDYVVRINPKDGKHGSYGVGSVQLIYAMEYYGVDSSWQGKAELVPLMLNNDMAAITVAYWHLMKYNHRSWFDMVKQYNGSGPRAEAYAIRVTTFANLLMECNYFEV